MELMDAIGNRRAVREYTDASVERAAIDRVIDVAILAPSAMNLQPWAFAVLLNRERIAGYGARIRQSTKRELGLPESYEAVMPIVLGYPKGRPESHGRHPVEIHWLG